MLPRIVVSDRLRGALKACVGGGFFFVGINLYFGSERFYEEFVMPTLRYLDPERVHHLSIQAAKYGLVPRMKLIEDPVLNTSVWNRHFKNPIGLAAGFDKNGEAIDGLAKFGFGFIEIGTITPRPQSGNEKPRVFRLTEDRAIINRYGFNNDGYEAVRARLLEYRQRTKNNKDNILIGVNIGRNKDTVNAVEQDYTLGIQQFGCLADYLVINVSSPNTPGLRALQGENELKQLLTSVRSACNKIVCDHDQDTNKQQRPLILLKVAPDLNENEIKSISNLIQQPTTKIDGLIVSNTTIARSDTLLNPSRSETGGLSGRPLKEKSLETLRLFRQYTQGQMPLIGVGGIETAEDIVDRMRAGASLVQIYTSLTYSGPPLVNKLNRTLVSLLKKEKVEHVHDLIGKAKQD